MEIIGYRVVKVKGENINTYIVWTKQLHVAFLENPSKLTVQNTWNNLHFCILHHDGLFCYACLCFCNFALYLIYELIVFGLSIAGLILLFETVVLNVNNFVSQQCTSVKGISDVVWIAWPPDLSLVSWLGLVVTCPTLLHTHHTAYQLYS